MNQHTTGSMSFDDVAKSLNEKFSDIRSLTDPRTPSPQYIIFDRGAYTVLKEHLKDNPDVMGDPTISGKSFFDGIPFEVCETMEDVHRRAIEVSEKHGYKIAIVCK